MDARVYCLSAWATLLTFILMVSCVPPSASTVAPDHTVLLLQSSAVSDNLLGDPHRCLDKARQSGDEMQTFEVLPGFGWDNLRNVAEGQVVSFNYSQCRTTEDGRFLLPDSVSAVPVKSSNVQTFAELITDWKHWTSTTSKSINVDSGPSLLKYFGISGRFSSEFEDIKSKQISHKSVITRTQLRFIRYGVQLQPDTPLHPAFKERVLAIADAQELGEIESVRYLAQLLVRDFGTHIVTKADVGASLEQVDQIKEDWVWNNMEKKDNILAAASASLFNSFHISASYDTKTDSEFLDAYMSQCISHSISTKGGPLVEPAYFTPDAWVADVDRNLVAMDRSGDPLFSVLMAATLPELSATALNEVSERVKEAVEIYYSSNTIPGCLDPKSPNFSPMANLDDGSCKPPMTNLSFGGVFQTCSMNPEFNNENLCSQLSQVNPKTGDFTCPANYRVIKLHSGTTVSNRTQNRCHSYWVFWTKCYDEYERSEANSTMYWCAATSSVPPRSGYLFGGLFTSLINNPVTQAFTCPSSFFPLKIGTDADLHVCISDDYEFGEVSSLPFAGFISCQAGNPLAVSDNRGSGQDLGEVIQDEMEVDQNSLNEFSNDEAHDWPMRCPDGFSGHLATVDQGCQINYCVQTGSMDGPVLPPIKRPPFMLAPPSDNLVIFDPATYTWKRNRMTLTQSVSPGTMVGIPALIVLGCMLLALAAVLVFLAKRRRQNFNSECSLLRGDIFY